MKKHVFIPIICGALMIMLIVFPEQSLAGGSDALDKWFSTVLPCLLPFFFLSGIIVQYLPKKIGFKNMWCAYFFVTGLCMLSGYPMSAKLTASLYSQKLLNRSSAVRLACVCSVTGPAFIVGAISTSMLASASLSLYLLPAHYISSLIIMLILQLARPVHVSGFYPGDERTPNLGKSMLESATSSFAAMLNICVLMVVFTAITRVISSSLPVLAPVAGVFEMTTGCFTVSSLDITLETKLVIISFLCSFAGLAIHAQSHSLFSLCGLKLKGFFVTKLVHGLLSALITFILLKTFTVPAPASSGTPGDFSVVIILGSLGVAVGIVSAVLARRAN